MADTLATKTIAGVEILRPGEWNGRHYTLADFDAMVTAFHALRGVFDAPAKLGHNEQQELLASDGLPAAGWVSNLYRQGNRLVADFRDVPAKIAALIDAGAYKKRSAEIFFNKTFDGVTYPAVLKAVSWLGADTPAVSGLDDIVAMYTDADGSPVFVVLGDFTFDAVRRAVGDELRERYPRRYVEGIDGMPVPDPEAEGPCDDIVDLYDDRVVVWDGDYDQLWQLPYTLGADGEATLGAPIPVLRVYQPMPLNPEENPDDEGADDAHMSDAAPATRAPAPTTRRAQSTRRDTKPPASAATTEGAPETMQDAELRTILGLAEGDDLKAKLIELKAGSVSLSDYSALSERVETLTANLAERDHRDAQLEAGRLVDDAIRGGKLAPKQKEWAVALALSDRASFTAYLTSAVKVVDYQTLAVLDESPADAEVTPQEATIARTMGVPLERLRAHKLGERAAAQVAG